MEVRHGRTRRVQMPPVTAVLVGAGQRGYFVYGAYAAAHPDELRFVGVADTDRANRERFRMAHGLGPEAAFERWEDLLAESRAELCVIATPDSHHAPPAHAALAAGYHVVLEKPIGVTARETARLVAAAAGRVHVGHVLRHTPFFVKVHEIVASGRLGDLVTVEHRENVAAWHMAHSYVRGNWGRVGEATPMIVAKCCHDFDILHWNLPSEVVRLWSTGSLIHFRPEHAPEGATQRCTDGCPAGERCPFDARRIYLDPSRSGWPVHVITDDLSEAGRRRALETGPYGRCVYTTGSDAVDHQVVAMELASGVSVSLTMHGHAGREARTMRYDGTRATLRGVFGHTTRIELIDHVSGAVDEIPVEAGRGGHGGGDRGFIGSVISAVRSGDTTVTSAEEALESHLLAFAAEESRVTGRVIDLASYRASVAG